jgi:hypothetical protein
VNELIFFVAGRSVRPSLSRRMSIEASNCAESIRASPISTRPPSSLTADSARTYHNACLFADLDEMHQTRLEWLRTHNEGRPTQAPGSLLPAPCRNQMLAVKHSTSELSACRESLLPDTIHAEIRIVDIQRQGTAGRNQFWVACYPGKTVQIAWPGTGRLCCA